mmetsp:Transcript_37396/g.61982  ORF Transcript_37396/g.61982 Transcript_37396/m.61982 type:complete len:686 (-) Transcript_37396:192-2249(-)
MAPPPQTNRQNEGSSIWTIISRCMMMYFVWQMFSGGKRAPPVNTTTGQPIPPHANIWNESQAFDMYVYMTETESFPGYGSKEDLIWLESNLRYNKEDTNIRKKQLNITLSDAVQSNGTLWAHVYFVPIWNGRDNKAAVIEKHIRLNKYIRRRKQDMRKNLLTASTTPDPMANTTAVATEPVDPQPVLSYWKPAFTLNLVTDHNRYAPRSIPNAMLEGMKFDSFGQNFYPILYVNEFWLLRDHLIPINDTVKEVSLELKYEPMSLWWWNLFTQMSQSWKSQESMGAMMDGESDELKRMFLEANPYLLGLTAVVSMVHMVFDFLAFSSDIKFWKENRSMEGLSVRTMFLNTGCQLVIFLYLFDNETSWMVLSSSGIGVLIEIWKLRKAVTFALTWKGWFPRLQWEDKKSYVDSKTKEFDALAMRYLSYVLYPLLIGYSIYSLVYETHRSWYSWILSSLTGAVYTFGFIMMTPQLFINYKLKSVAHLPWKTFTYKALNTFIDDLFAFIIKMPTLHRLACFRDDIIFFIYLYQRWIYPVDKTRVNEFGQGGEDPSTAVGAVEAAKDTNAAAQDVKSGATDTNTEQGVTSSGDVRKRKNIKNKPGVTVPTSDEKQQTMKADKTSVNDFVQGGEDLSTVAAVEAAKDTNSAAQGVKSEGTDTDTEKETPSKITSNADVRQRKINKNKPAPD